MTYETQCSLLRRDGIPFRRYYCEFDSTDTFCGWHLEIDNRTIEEVLRTMSEVAGLLMRLSHQRMRGDLIMYVTAPERRRTCMQYCGTISGGASSLASCGKVNDELV